MLAADAFQAVEIGTFKLRICFRSKSSMNANCKVGFNFQTENKFVEVLNIKGCVINTDYCCVGKWEFCFDFFGRLRLVVVVDVILSFVAFVNHNLENKEELFYW